MNNFEYYIILESTHVVIFVINHKYYTTSSLNYLSRKYRDQKHDYNKLVVLPNIHHQFLQLVVLHSNISRTKLLIITS